MKVLIVSAHPDDEILGAGGTLLRHKSQGDEIHWLILTNILVEEGFEQSRIDSRQSEIDQVEKRIGMSSVRKLDFPTMKLSYHNLPSIISGIDLFIKEVSPQLIYTMNGSDAHSDHRIGFEAVMACTKSFRNKSIKEVLMYECISETEFAPPLSHRVFLPNVFVDITPYIDEKLDVLSIYESELGPHPFPRSRENVSALARFRGATAGVHYAEAFQLLKRIV